MPNPGSSSILSSLATYSFTPEGGATPLFFSSGAQMIQKLATAIDAGWTCSSPVTPSTMVTAFTAEFAGFFTLPAGAIGQQFIMGLAQGIDEDITAWVASYVYPPGSGTHTYTVTDLTIKNRIIALSPLVSNGSTALINAVSETFANSFQQEVG